MQTDRLMLSGIIFVNQKLIDILKFAGKTLWLNI